MVIELLSKVGLFAVFIGSLILGTSFSVSLFDSIMISFVVFALLAMIPVFVRVVIFEMYLDFPLISLTEYEFDAVIATSAMTVVMIFTVFLSSFLPFDWVTPIAIGFYLYCVGYMYKHIPSLHPDTV